MTKAALASCGQALDNRAKLVTIQAANDAVNAGQGPQMEVQADTLADNWLK